jgi:xanthine dehydrogenase small subunit
VVPKGGNARRAGHQQGGDGGRARPEPRVAFGSVAATVVRAPATERVLADGGSIDDAHRALTSEIRPIDDVRSTAEYRLRVAGNLLRQFWAETA